MGLRTKFVKSSIIYNSTSLVQIIQTNKILNLLENWVILLLIKTCSYILLSLIMHVLKYNKKQHVVINQIYTCI